MLLTLSNEYCSSVTFAMRKQQQAEHGKDDLLKEIKEQEDERLKHQNEILERENRIKAFKIRTKERKETDLKKRTEEIKFLTFQRDHLSTFLKQIEEKWDTAV